MGAEEKKSLPSDEGHPSAGGKTSFRLHYFPDIPVDGRLGVRRCAPDRAKFQRTQYDSSDPVCLDSTADVDVRRALARQAALSADEREERAYQKGFDEGRARGMSDGETVGLERGTQKIEPLINSIKEALIQLNAIRKETYRQIDRLY